MLRNGLHQQVKILKDLNHKSIVENRRLSIANAHLSKELNYVRELPKINIPTIPPDLSELKD